MACDININNYKGSSILYKDLLDITGNVETATRLYLQTKTDTFKAWFGDSTSIDENGEPIPKIDIDNYDYVFTNKAGNTKSIKNYGSFGRQYTTSDVIRQLQKDGVITKHRYKGKYWVVKGETIDGENLLEQHTAKIRNFNRNYENKYNQSMIFVYTEGTSKAVEVNEVFLNYLNDRNSVDINYASAIDPIEDIDASVINVGFSSIDGVNVKQEAYIVNIASDVLLRAANKFTQLKMKQAIAGDTVRSRVARIIAEKSRRFYTGINGTPITIEEHELNKRLANKILTSDLLWNKIRANAKINSGINVVDLQDLDIDPNDVSNTFNENAQFFIPPDARISSKVKHIINTTKDIEHKTASLGGMPTVLNSSEVIPHLIQNISNATSLQDMLDKLSTLAITNAAYADIHDKLETNDDLSAAFFSTMKSESLLRVINVFDKDATANKDKLQLKVRNKESYIKYSLSRAWLDTLTSRVYSDFYVNANLLDSINNAYNDFLTAISTKESTVTEAKTAQLVKFFSNVGFDITSAMIEGFVNDPIARSKVKPATKSGLKYKYSLDFVEDSIGNAVLDTVFKDVMDSINSFINDTNTKKEFDGFGNILKLADSVGMYVIPETIAYINILGNQEQTYNKPTFIGDWFSMMDNDAMFKARLTNMLRDPMLRYSSWLLNTSSLQGDRIFRHDGFLNMPEDVTMHNVLDNLDKLELNKSFYRTAKANNFQLYFYDGFSETSNSQNIKYSGILEDDWAFVSFAKFISGNNFSEDEFKNTTNRYNGMYPFINPADRANARDLSAPIFDLESKHLRNRTLIDNKSDVFKAVYNNFVAQVQRMEQARKDLYTLDDNGNRVYAPTEKLIAGYHYKRVHNRKTNKVTISKVKNGRLVGNAFKFYNFSYTNIKGDIIDINSLFNNDIGAEILTDGALLGKVDIFITHMLASMIKEQRDVLVPILNSNTKIKQLAKTIKDVDTLIAEFTVNRFIANIEMLNFFVGDVAFYGDSETANKRASILLSSGVVNSKYGTNASFFGATVGDRIVSANIVNDITTTLTKQNVDSKLIDAIVSPYKEIESTDGVSYITLKEFENRARLYGIFSEYESLFDKLNDESSAIDVNELNAFVQLQKNIYHSYEFDGSRFVPTQVKNSEMVLIPRFIKGTDLETIYDAMITNKLVQLNFASAEKVGSRYIGHIANKNGTINAETISSELAKSKRQYLYKDLRKQQDVINHVIDAVNKHGTQLAKKILDNVKDTAIIDEVFQLTVENIIESAEDIKEDLGITKTDTGYDVDIDKLSGIMLEQYIQQSKNKNYIYGVGVDQVTKTFKLPLDMSVTRVKNESLFNSIFTSRIINQKHPGIHGPQASNAFMNAVKSTTAAQGTLPFKKGDNTLRPLAYSAFKDVNGKLTFQYAEVLLPQWSRKFFSENADITIEQLQAAGLDQMLGYRIPTEGKQSMFVFKVVGFLDNAQGSSIVVPDAFVAQTGSDFDIDSVYTMSYNFNINTKGDPTKINLETTANRKWYNSWVRRQIPSSDNELYSELSGNVFEIRRLESDHAFTEYVDRHNFKGNIEEFKKQLKSGEYEQYIERINNTRKELLNTLSIDKRKEFAIDKAEMDKQDIRGIERIEYYMGTVDELTDEINADTSSNPLKITINASDKAVLDEMYSLHTEELRVYGVSQAKIAEFIENYTNEQNADLETVKTKQRELFESINYEIADMFANKYKLPTYEAWSALVKENPLRYNTRKARQNRTLDLYIKVLTSPDVYLENVTPNLFSDTTTARKVSDAFFNPTANLTNYASPTTQTTFRRISLASRDLKGISVNHDGFLSIAQRVGLRLTDESAIRVKYNIDKPIKTKVDGKTVTLPAYTIEQLNESFGEENVEPDGTVLLKIFGNNFNGTFKNIEGQFITSYTAQATAHILDSVKIPLPYGVTNETVSIWKLLPSLGSNWTTSTLFINQEVVDRINRHTNSKSGITTDYRGYPIDGAKLEIAKELFHYYALTNDPLLEELDGDPKNIASATKRIKGYKHANVSRTILEQILNFKTNEAELSDRFLIDQLNKRRGFNKLKPADKINYLHDQLGLLYIYEELAYVDNKINDFQMLNAYDKSKIGPEFIDISNLKELYSTVNSTTYDNILVTEDGSNYLDAIYNGEAYTPLKAFKEHGFDLAYGAFNKLFITQSEPIKMLLRNYSKDQHRSVINHVLAYNTNKASFFDIADRSRVMGMDKQSFIGVDLTKYTPESITAFKKLSATSKLNLVKNAYKEYIDNNNILYYLNPIYSRDFINKYNYTDVAFRSDKQDDIFIDSFTKLWYNKNIYVHLLAQDLVKLAFYSKGLTFGRNISKVIPANVLFNPHMPFVDALGVEMQVEGEPILHGVGYTTNMQNQRNLHFEDTFVNTYDEVFRYNYARSNWRNSSIVPRVTLDESYDVASNSRVLRRGAINWRATENDRIISVTSYQFDNLPNNIKRADVVKDVVNKNTTRLFAKVKSTDASGRVIYKYIPVTKADPYEFDSVSTNPINYSDDVAFTIDEYLAKINVDRDIDISNEAEEVTKNESERVYKPDTTFETTKSGGYNERTRLNATADATIAIATDFSSRGEVSTKKFVDDNNRLYIPIDYTTENIDKTIAIIVGKLNTQQARTLNIAGNGINTLTANNITQAQADNTVYNIIRSIIYHPDLNHRIEKIRTGGQTGIDEAGTKAARRLGIPNLVLAPAGYRYRTANGKDISSRSGFLNRFESDSSITRDQEMRYPMPVSQNIFGYDTTTIAQVENGNRIATTRSFKLGKIGDIVTFNGRPAKYLILNTEELTKKVVKDTKWIEDWSRKEGWTTEYFNDTLANPKKKTVRLGSWQTTFAKITTKEEDANLELKFASAVDPTTDYIDYNKSRMEFARGISSDYNIRLKRFPNMKVLRSTVNKLNKINWADSNDSALLAAFRANIHYVDYTIGQLEKRIFDDGGYANEEVLKNIIESTDRLEFSRFMNFTNVFLKGFQNIRNLQPTVKKDSDLTTEERALNSAINKLTSYAQRVNVLQASYRTISNTYFEKILTPLSTNPAIKLNIRQLFDLQDDESKTQLLLDSLADTHHSFVANFIKKFIIDRGAVRKRISDKHAEYDAKMEELLAKYKMEDIMEGDNKLIQEFSNEYKQDRDDYRDRLIATEAKHTKYSVQYYNLEKEYNQWIHDNLLSEEFKSVEKAKMEANDILYKNFTARRLVDELKEKKNLILRNNDGLADMNEMSAQDTAALRVLDEHMKRLQNPYDENGIRKTGDLLDIAETISSYTSEHGIIIDKYYKTIVEDSIYRKQYDLHKDSTTPESMAWKSRNTINKVHKQFWTDFADHSKTLGRNDMETAIKALNPFRDKDGIVNGNQINESLRAVIKEANEARFKDIEDRAAKAIVKPQTNEAYDDDYYSHYEDRGEDTREDDETIEELNAEIEEINKSYINDDGVIDTASISIEDLDRLITLQQNVRLLRSFPYQMTRARDRFNTWFRLTHKSNTDYDAYNKAKAKAKANGRAYSNRWNKVNTADRLEESYYTMIETLRKKFNITKKERAIFPKGGINPQAVRDVHNVNSFAELPDDIKKSIANTKSDKYAGTIGGRPVYTLAEYTRNHVIKAKNEKFATVEEAAAEIKRLYTNKLKKEVGTNSKWFRLLDALDYNHDYIPTAKYERMLKKEGKGGTWYNDNHTINHRGEIVPIPYWIDIKPKAAKHFTKNAPNPKYWNYNTVKDKMYVDDTKSISKKWMNDHVDYVETTYYTAKKAEMQLKSSDEYSKWYNDNHFYNPYTHQYQPIAIWTTMTAGKDYVIENSPLKMMTTNEIKPEFSNVQELDKDGNKTGKLLNDPYRSIHNRPLPRKTSKYHYDNRAGKSPKFKNYRAVQANPLYAYITELLQDLTQHYDKDTILDEQALPITYKSGGERNDSPAKRLLKKIGWYNYGSRAVTGENNESVRILNLPNISPINKEEELPIPKAKEFTDRKEYLARHIEVVAHNKEIKAVNDEYNTANMDTDFPNVIRNFINTAYSHQFMYEHEHEMRMALEEIRNLDLAKRRNLLERLRNITRDNLAKEQAELFEGDPKVATEKGVGSNLESHFKSFMDMIFYGEFELDEGMWTNISRVMQNFTSAKGMWLNSLGAFNNVAYGNTQVALEAASGYYFSIADLAKATKLYTANMFTMMAETGQDKSKSYINALIKEFDVVELQDEAAISNNVELDRAIHKKLLSTNNLYIMHHIGEHYMQNSGLIATMHSHRLINGKASSFVDYTYDLQYKSLMNVLTPEGKHGFDKFIEDNKNKDIYLDGKSDLIRDFILQSEFVDKKQFLIKNKELFEEAKNEFYKQETVNGKKFDTFPRMIDVYSLDKDIGKVTLNNDPNTGKAYEFSQMEYDLFRRKVVSINQKIHGIYNKLDAGTIQKTGLGRLMIQFKKWMRPGWTKRFGSRLGKTHWNEARGEHDTGMYISTYRFLTKPIGDAISGVRAKELEVAEALSGLMADYRAYITNIGTYWGTLNETDKANIRRTMAETLQFAAVGALMWMLRGLADDDDEDKKSWAYAMYATDRLMTEILAYNPFYGFTNETRKLLRDPFAAMAMMDDISKLVYTSIFERDQYYKGGIYHGESKMGVQWKKNIPLFNRWLRYENIQDYAGYYKLY